MGGTHGVSRSWIAVVLVTVGLLVASTSAGVGLTFSPPTASVAPGTPAVFTVSVTGATAFNCVDIVFASNTWGPAGNGVSAHGLSFVWNPAVTATLSDVTDGGNMGMTSYPYEDWVEAFSDAGAGVGPSVVLGTLTLQTTGLAPGNYTLVVSGDSDTASSILYTDGEMDLLNGNLTVVVSSTPPGFLSVAPTGGLASAGAVGGPFSPGSMNYTLTNTGGQPLSWTAGSTQPWVSPLKMSGTLAAGASDTVAVMIKAAAKGLVAGSYSATVVFTNTTNSNGNTTRPVTLTVTPASAPAPTSPVAQAAAVSARPDVAMSVALLATDDGLPNPPAALTYVITSLPGHGSLSDPNAGTIVSVPYTLASLGNRVVYTSAGGYTGTDAFQFKANDGGTPPGGGDSNLATVTIAVVPGDSANAEQWTWLGLTDTEMRCVAVAPGDSNVVLAGGAALHVSTDKGATWTTAPNIAEVQCIAFGSSKNEVFVGTWGSSGIYKSIDVGSTWSPCGTGLANTVVKSICVLPGNDQVVYAGTEAGLYKSTNAGTNWLLVKSGVNASAIAISPLQPQTVYLGTWGGGTWKSTDSGATWTAIGAGTLSSNTCYGIAIDLSNLRIVYAVFGDGGVWTSQDAGANWALGSPGFEGVGVACDNQRPGFAYALGGWTVPQRTGCYGGNGWRAMSQGWQTGWFARGITVDPNDCQCVYACAGGAGLVRWLTDATPPDTVAGLAAVPFGNVVQLTWNASPSSDCTGYWIYKRSGSDPYGLIPSFFVNGGQTTSFSDPQVVVGVTYAYEVVAVDAAQNHSLPSNEAAVTIMAPPPTITTPGPLPSGTVGVAYSQGLTAAGGAAPYAWSIASGSLPAGLSLSSSGVISGTPSAVATAIFTVQVAGNDGLSSTKDFSLTIHSPLSITCSSPLAGGTVGATYNQTLTATGGVPPYTWLLSAGALPAGLNLSTDGIISGTPSTATAATFTIQVTDNDGASSTKDFSLTILAVAYSWTNFVGQPGSWGGADGTGSAARFFYPTGVAVDSAGNVYIADQSNNAIRKATPDGVVTTFAGRVGYSGSADGTGSTARFDQPAGVAMDSAGNLYVADEWNNTIRKVTPDGVVTTLAGQAGSKGSADGTGSVARFYYPHGVAVDSAGNVYVGDMNNNTIRKVTPAGVVTTLAGLAGSYGSADGTGNVARFSNPAGVAVDSAGNVYVADYSNYTIRKVTPAGVVTTLAGLALSGGGGDGTGSAARFYYPSGVATDGTGNVYVADTYMHTIRRVTPAGVVTTIGGAAAVSGSTDGVGPYARFNRPAGVAVDATGNLYVADKNNQRISRSTFVQAPTITTTSPLPDGKEADVYNQTLAATGGTSPYTWSITSGSLPSGLSLGSSGVISGLPIVATTANFTVLVTGSDGAFATKSFSLTITVGRPTITTTGPLAGGSVGVAYNQTLSASGGVKPYTWSIASGSLPPGLNLSSAGVISGTPNAAAAASFTVQVAGNDGAYSTKDFTLTVIAVPPTITTGSRLSGGTVGIAYNQALAATAGATPYTWSVTSGSLPSGLSLSSDGVISGTPSTPGTAGFTVQVAGNDGLSSTQSFTLTIDEAYAWTNFAGLPGTSGSTDGTGSTARFNNPCGIAVDAAGNMYVADEFNNTIRKVTPAGVVTTLAGLAGSRGSADGAGSQARFSDPAGVAVDNAGNVYVADLDYSTIRKVTPDGVVTTLAGLTGNNGSADGTGSAARFYWPSGVTVDSAGNVYVADQYNHTIRKVTPAGVVTTLAGQAGSSGSADGTASAARFYYPSGVAVDSAGNLYVADKSNYTIRKVTPDGVVTTLAGLAGSSGSADSTGSAARFSGPYGVAVDGAGNVYVADGPNCTIRKVTPAGVVTTLGGQAGSSGSSDGTGSAARFKSPHGVTVDMASNLYVADTSNHRISKGVPVGPPTIATTSPLPDGTAGAAYNQTLTATGGMTPYTWSISSGALPAGLSLSTSGIISGTPTDPATAIFMVQVTGNDGQSSMKDFGLTIVAGPPTITTASPLPSGSVGASYNQILTATGGTMPYVWSITSGSLPAGFTLSSGGVISGTCSVSGTASFTIQVTGSDGLSSAAGFNLTIDDAYAWTNFVGQPGGPGSLDGTGSAAQFNRPYGLAVDSAGNIYVADTDNDTIRKITPAGVVTTLAGLAGNPGTADGTGSAARFGGWYMGPIAVAADSAGNVYVADGWNDTIRKITPDGAVTTLAGQAGTFGSADGTGSAARFTFPQGVAVDMAGNVYVADTLNCTIRKVTPDGAVTTLAGQAGTFGSADGTGSAARFDRPSGVAVDGTGNVYVADTGNHTIRKVTPDRVVTTLAGLVGSSGSVDGAASSARFDSPYSVAVDSTGNLYVADTQNNTIRKVTQDGVVTTLAGLAGSSGSADGTGSAARFNQPHGVAVDSAGNVYLADQENSTIRMVSPAGVVTTLAGQVGSIGSADGNGSAARFNWTRDVAVDSAGNLYVVDEYNHTIRKVTAAGVVTTLAGLAGSSGSADGTGSDARFNTPAGVAVDTGGNVYVADQDNHTIRKVTPAGVVTTLAGLAGAHGSTDGTAGDARFYYPTGVAVDNAGNVYVADQINYTIRKVTPAGVVTTLAGLAGSSGSADGTGSAARFNDPIDLTVDHAGNVYVVEWLNHTIRKVTPAGVVTTLAGSPGSFGSADGTGSAARFWCPEGIAVDSVGNLYVGDTRNCTIRKVTPAGVVTTVGGMAGIMTGLDGIGTAARFSSPEGMAIDAAGNLYVADSSNNRVCRGTRISGPPPTPNFPAPGTGQMNLPAESIFSWNMAAPGRTFDVYLDTTNPPAVKVASGITTASIAPSLTPGTRYYWKVVAVSADGQTEGPVWTFTTRLPGDSNGDGCVNVDDLLAVVAAWASQAGPPPSSNWSANADLNGDGFVNIGDLQILVAHWGQSAN